MQARLAQVQALIEQEPSTPEGAEGLVGALQRLCAAAARAIPAAGAGVSLMSEGGGRGVAAASSEVSGRYEELQFTVGEGPCIDAFAFRRPVLEPALDNRSTGRWPVYSQSAHEGGVRAVFSFPLQVGAARLGVLDVYRTDSGSLTAEELAQALAFAQVAVLMLLDGQREASPGCVAEGLDEALAYRSTLYQAQGMVMIQLGVPLGEALVRLRAFAFAHERRLSSVALDVVARRLRLDQ